MLLLFWLDTVPVLAFDYAAGVFPPPSNMTCNVILAVLYLALARRNKERKGSCLDAWRIIILWSLVRNPCHQKRMEWPHWKVLEKLEARHCVQVDMHKTNFEGFSGT